MATSVFTPGQNRLAFGMIDKQGRFVYGPTASTSRRTPGAPAKGPYAAPADVLLTQGRYRSKQAATEAGPVRRRLRGPGAVRQARQVVGAGRHQGRRQAVAAPGRSRWSSQAQDHDPRRRRARAAERPDRHARLGEGRHRLDRHAPAAAARHARASRSTDVVGKKPVALLFATPQLCQSRVCGPVTDVAAQMKAKYGNRMEFIHQEVYEDNDPNKGLREPLERLPPAHGAVAVRRQQAAAASRRGWRGRSV